MSDGNQPSDLPTGTTAPSTQFPPTLNVNATVAAEEDDDDVLLGTNNNAAEEPSDADEALVVADNTANEISAAYERAAFTLGVNEDVSANPILSQRIHRAFIDLLIRGGPTPFEYIAGEEPSSKRTKKGNDDESSGKKDRKSKKDKKSEKKRDGEEAGSDGNDIGSEEASLVESSEEGFVPGAGGESEPDSDIVDFDAISENESDRSPPSDGDLDAMDGGAFNGGAMDPAFNRWMEGGDAEMEDDFNRDGSVATTAARPERSAVMSWELSRLQLTEADDNIVSGSLPERFAEAAFENNRPNLESAAMILAKELGHSGADLMRELPDGGRGSDPRWVLKQLCRPGCLLAHSRRACAVNNLPDSQIDGNPIILAIDAVMGMMNSYHLEPAHIAVYYPDQIKPLVDALWDGTVEGGINGLSYVAESYPYSPVTGRRQRPIFGNDQGEIVSETHPGGSFNSFSHVVGHPTAADDLDPLWAQLEGASTQAIRSIRRPCIMEVGRLLWAIFDLDMLGQKIELGRIRMFVDMVNVDGFAVHSDILKRESFTEACELEFWSGFSRYSLNLQKDLQAIHAHSDSDERRLERANRNGLSKAYLSVLDLRLDRAFNDIYLPAETYHRNLDGDRKEYPIVPPSNQVLDNTLRTIGANEELMTWLGRCGKTCGKDVLGTIQLFTSAFVEQYIELPLAQKAIFEAFMIEGIVTFYPNTNSSSAVGDALKLLSNLFPNNADSTGIQTAETAGVSTGKSVHIAQIMGNNAQLFLEAYRQTQSANGKRPLLRIEFHLEESVALRALKLDTHFFSSSVDMNSEINKFRRESFVEMSKCLIGRVTQHVRQAILYHSNQVAAQVSMTELGKWASEGPYQPTMLVLSQYDENAPTWDPQYNVVESIPEGDVAVEIAGNARVCSAVRSGDAHSSTVTFAFCDEFGTCNAQLTWVECNVSRPEGRATHQRQCQDLLALVGRFTPNVIAVAACNGSRTAMLFRALREFVQNYVVPGLYHTIPVVWVPYSPGVIFRHSDAANRELPNADPTLRSAIACARYLRDPLMELCRYFEPNSRAILGLPLGIQRGADMSVVYKFLEREMSLWVSATGFSAKSVFAQSHSEQVLQFCAGLGRRKAKALLTLNSISSQNITSRAILREATTHIGGGAVTNNFISTLRVFPTVDIMSDNLSTVDPLSADEKCAMPLDRTLIPDAMYPAAEQLASIIARSSDLSHDFPAIAWTILDAMTPEERFASHLVNIDDHHLVECCTVFELHPNQISFILDEIIALGAERLRRNFRKMTTRRLVQELTGVTYYSKSDLVDRSNALMIRGSSNMIANPSKLSADLTLHEGDVLECAIAGVRLKPRPAIRLRTNRDLEAVLGVEERDFDDAVRRPQLLEYIDVLQEIQDERDRLKDINGGTLPDSMRPIRPDYKPPSFLENGAPVYGEIVGFNAFRCEFRVRWTDAAPTQAPVITAEDVLRRLSRVDKDMLLLDGQSAASRASSQGRDSVAPSEADSIKTVDLTRHEAASTTKASGHRLFRNCTSQKILELLNRCQIGEILLRPCSEKFSNWALLCIKVGVSIVSNWAIKELRGQSGATFYEIDDPRSGKRQSFESIDHISHSMVKHMTKYIDDFRNHRAFKNSIEAASVEAKNSLERIVATVDCAKNKAFGYAFSENVTQAELDSSLPVYKRYVYQVTYYFNDEKHLAPVHITNNGIYVKLRQMNSNTFGWLQCETAEGLATKLKVYTSQRMKVKKSTKH